MSQPCVHEKDFGAIEQRFIDGERQFDDMEKIKSRVFWGLVASIVQIVAVVYFLTMDHAQLQMVTSMATDMRPKVDKLVYLHEKDVKP